MKLYKYGVRGVAYDWIQSYLQDRNQFVSFNDCDSRTVPIKCGVHQGSILGPSLFLIYVNDLASVSSVLFTIPFADETTVFITGKNIPNLITVTNNELLKLSEWMNVNKLSLNVKKTKYMLFCMKKPHKEGGNILLNEEIIDKVNHSKCLGVIIDSHLSWMDHVQHIRKKISKGINIYCTKQEII